MPWSPQPGSDTHKCFSGSRRRCTEVTGAVLEAHRRCSKTYRHCLGTPKRWEPTDGVRKTKSTACNTRNLAWESAGVAFLRWSRSRSHKRRSGTHSCPSGDHKRWRCSGIHMCCLGTQKRSIVAVRSLPTLFRSPEALRRKSTSTVREPMAALQEPKAAVLGPASIVVKFKSCAETIRQRPLAPGCGSNAEG